MMAMRRGLKKASSVEGSTGMDRCEAGVAAAKIHQADLPIEVWPVCVNPFDQADTVDFASQAIHHCRPDARCNFVRISI